MRKEPSATGKRGRGVGDRAAKQWRRAETVQRGEGRGNKEIGTRWPKGRCGNWQEQGSTGENRGEGGVRQKRGRDWKAQRSAAAHRKWAGEPCRAGERRGDREAGEVRAQGQQVGRGKMGPRRAGKAATRGPSEPQQYRMEAGHGRRTHGEAKETRMRGGGEVNRDGGLGKEAGSQSRDRAGAGEEEGQGVHRRGERRTTRSERWRGMKGPRKDGGREHGGTRRNQTSGGGGDGDGSSGGRWWKN